MASSSSIGQTIGRDSLRPPMHCLTGGRVGLVFWAGRCAPGEVRAGTCSVSGPACAGRPSAVQLQPRLITVACPVRAEGVVLLLHGGARRGNSMMVSPTQLSVLRMIPISRRVSRAGRGELAVFRLLNAVRGWDCKHTPVQDAAWALDEIAAALGGPRPTCLIGHSLGGRAALLSAARAEVQSVVALAPWVYASDVANGLSDEQILIVHGSADRVARPALSAALARRLARRARVGYVTVEGGKHAMLRHHAQFDRLAAEFAAATLLGEPASSAIERIQAGQSCVTV